MNKRLLVLGLSSILSLPVATMAAGPKVYGTIHSSIDYLQTGSEDSEIHIDSSSRRGWALGAKGDADVSGGMAAIYRFEIGFDGNKNSAISNKGDADVAGNLEGNFYQRDSWVGLKGGFGKIRVGTMATFYKATGKMVDPLFTTALEGRGSTYSLMSDHHSGNGVGKGRGTQMISYDSPRIAGMMKLNFHLQPRDGGDYNYGIGGKARLGPVTGFGAITTNPVGDRSYKGGVKADFGPASVAAHFEIGKDTTGADIKHSFSSLSYRVTRELKLAANAGYALEEGDIGFGGAALFSLARQTMMYLAGGMAMPDSGSNTQIASLGLKHSF